MALSRCGPLQRDWTSAASLQLGAASGLPSRWRAYWERPASLSTEAPRTAQTPRRETQARQNPEKYPWLTQLLARRPFKVVAIALANKTARVAWALLARGGTYRVPALAAA